MARTSKDLKKVRYQLRRMVNQGEVEPEHVTKLAAALKRLEHAMSVQDNKGIVKAINEIAKTFLRD